MNATTARKARETPLRKFNRPRLPGYTNNHTIAYIYCRDIDACHSVLARWLVMARLRAANHDLRERRFHVKRQHPSRPNGFPCLNASSNLVCLYVCRYVYQGFKSAFPPHCRIGHILDFEVRSKELRNVCGAGTVGGRL